jgi:carboxypeptidase PM20D1
MSLKIAFACSKSDLYTRKLRYSVNPGALLMKQRVPPVHTLWAILLSGFLAGGTPASPAHRLAQAVQYQTISYTDTSRIDYSEFDRLNAYLGENFPLAFSRLQVELVNNYSLLLRWPGSDASLKPILFTAHTDVVPIEPGTEQDWTHPPFAGRIADGRIYGRGTLDDKIGVLGLLEAVESLLAEAYRPRRGIVLAFGHDEEISGPQGAVQLARRMRELGLHFQWMVDEGGMVLEDAPMLPGRTVAMINVAEKGYMVMTLATTGEGGHASRPPQISTIGRLSNALARIEANPFETRMVEPVSTMFETLAPHVDQPQRFIFNNLWLTGGLVAWTMADDATSASFVRTTTALTVFNAGVKDNVLPQRAEAMINFRLLPGDTPEGVAARIEELIDDPQVEISYKLWGNMPPVSSVNGPGYQVISQATQAVYPEAVVIPSLLVATTDSRHYVDLADDLYRFHGMELGFSQSSSVHGTNEYVTLDSYLKSIEVARHMIRLGSE